MGILRELRLIPSIVGHTKGRELTRGKEMTEFCTLNLHIRYKLNIGVESRSEVIAVCFPQKG